MHIGRMPGCILASCNSETKGKVHIVKGGHRFMVKARMMLLTSCVFFAAAQGGTIFREPNNSCSPCISVLAPRVQGQMRTYLAVRKLLSKPCARKVTLGGFLFRCALPGFHFLSPLSTVRVPSSPYLTSYILLMSDSLFFFPCFLCCVQKASQRVELPAFPE